MWLLGLRGPLSAVRPRWGARARGRRAPRRALEGAWACSGDSPFRTPLIYCCLSTCLSENFAKTCKSQRFCLALNARFCTVEVTVTLALCND